MDLDQFQPHRTTFPHTSLKTNDGCLLTFPCGEANEPLQGDSLDIDPRRAADAIKRLAFYAIDDAAEAAYYAQHASANIVARGTVGSVLSARIYKDRLHPDDCA